MVQNPYQPYSPYQQAQYMPYQGTYTYPTQPVQEQMPVYGYRTQNTAIQKPPSMSGRVVSQEAEITPQEVPMDGSFSWFPMADGSAVIGKRWNSDGTIQTVRYAPEEQEPRQAVEAVPAYVSDISTRLDRIEGILTQRARRAVKKEASDA